MARMFDPPHPGLTLRDDVLPALGMGVTDAAKALGVSRVALSRVLNGRAAVSPEFALRLEAWLGVERGGDAAVWLAMQNAYDLWHAEQSLSNRPAPFTAPPEVARYAESKALRSNMAQAEVEWSQAAGTARTTIAAASVSSLAVISAATDVTSVLTTVASEGRQFSISQ